MLGQLATRCLALAAVFFLGRLLYRGLLAPLQSIPGPFWAKYTRLWYFRQVARGQFQKDNLELHRKYGPVVRVAPGMYSIDMPDSIDKIYGVGANLRKSKWYNGWAVPLPNFWGIFDDRNIRQHAENKRVFTSIYSMSSLVSYEAFVDDSTDIFQKRLTEFAATGESINLHHWLRCYALDVISSITFPERFGFLDKGDDIFDFLATSLSNLKYSSLMGIYYEVHRFLWFVFAIIGNAAVTGKLQMINVMRNQIAMRKKEHAQSKDQDVMRHTSIPQTFLDKMLMQHQEAPKKVTDYHIFIMCITNIMAGADTTAISLSSIIYYLARHADALQKLREEVEDKSRQGLFQHEHIEYKTTRDMPYLQAVLKESLRLHAATGLPLWREVGSSGMTLNGQFFPAGTVIGVNTWNSHYNKDVYGQDASEFRPERWIEAREEGGDKLARMNAHYIPFGSGPRTCIGKNISYLEMCKLVPLIVKNFDFELESQVEWETINYWFVAPTNFNVKVKKRVF